MNTELSFDPQGVFINKVTGQLRSYAWAERTQSWHLARTENIISINWKQNNICFNPRLFLEC
jgi:hypothetical protein